MVKEDSSTILATEQLRHKQVKNLITSNSTPKYEKRKRGKSADRGKQEMLLLSTLGKNPINFGKQLNGLPNHCLTSVVMPETLLVRDDYYVM